MRWRRSPNRCRLQNFRAAKFSERTHPLEGWCVHFHSPNSLMQRVCHPGAAADAPRCSLRSVWPRDLFDFLTSCVPAVCRLPSKCSCDIRWPLRVFTVGQTQRPGSFSGPTHSVSAFLTLWDAGGFARRKT
jgi:hypothetical protein